MPYKSEAQRKFLHAKHPEIAARWDAEIARKRKEKVSKAREHYVPVAGRMNDESMARAKDRQKMFSLTNSALGIGGLSAFGAGLAMKKRKPELASKLTNTSTNAAIIGSGIGAMSGINFARIQNEESKRAREMKDLKTIKKSNYGAGYSTYYSDPVEVDSVPVRIRHSSRDWRARTPYTISPKAYDPERSRERRARLYTPLMGAGAVGASGLTAAAASAKRPEVPKNKDGSPKKIGLERKILRSKPLRVGAAGALTTGLAAGAVYNAKRNNRASYSGEWYPERERY